MKTAASCHGLQVPAASAMSGRAIPWFVLSGPATTYAIYHEGKDEWIATGLPTESGATESVGSA
jgi:hypothetical protein